MALEEKYVRVFRKECVQLSLIILDSLKILSVEPKNKVIIEKMVQSADTIIGDSRFVGDADLEKAAKMIVDSFKGVEDATDKFEELQFFTSVFQTILSRP
jgi:chemotaxis protein histidine kinase CheA